MTTDLLCIQYHNLKVVPQQVNKRSFQSYRGFTLPSVKLLIGYLFAGYVLKIEKNNQQLRYDVYLRSLNDTTNEQINVIEVDKFLKFFGKGFNIIILSQTQFESK